MTLAANKEIVQRWVEAIDRHDLAAVDELVAPHLVGRMKDGFARGFTTFGDHRVAITDMVAEGDKVWVLLATRGTHAGVFQGVPPTGRAWTNRGVAFLRVVDGKIIEHANLFDNLNLLRQIGATITPPSAVG